MNRGRARRRTGAALVVALLTSVAACGSSDETAPTEAPFVTVAASLAPPGTGSEEPTTAPDTTAVDGTSPPEEPVDDGAVEWVPAAPLTGNPFGEAVGEWVGGDIPRVHPLPDGRQVWWLNDSFLPVDGKPPVDQFEFVRNLAFIRDRDGALTMLAGGSPGQRSEFLPHPTEEDRFTRFLWPLGGVVDGRRLKMFVAEMQCLDPSWGVCFDAISTYLAVYRWSDMELLSLRPAPNPGTSPVYGFSVASDDTWTYLFGNGMDYTASVPFAVPDPRGDSNQTFVARVPLGQVERQPRYWDGSGWSRDPDRAVPVVERGTDFRMSVVHWKGRWIGTAKLDEFMGWKIVIMEAPRPEGPWRDIGEIPLPPDMDEADIVTYDAIPYPEPVDGRLAVLYSRNSTIEAKVFADPSVYRPVIAITDIE